MGAGGRGSYDRVESTGNSFFFFLFEVQEGRERGGEEMRVKEKGEEGKREICR